MRRISLPSEWIENPSLGALTGLYRHRFAQVIGPRVVGGCYYSGYWRKEYKVEEVDISDVTPVLTVRWQDGEVTVHCTPWEVRGDRVLTGVLW